MANEQEDPSVIISEVINNIKSSGMFDKLRRECMEEMGDTEAYSQMERRMSNHVTSFLSKQRWDNKTSKNALRDGLRKHINESEVLQNGVHTLIEKVLLQYRPIIGKHIGDEVDKFFHTNEEKPETVDTVSTIQDGPSTSTSDCTLQSSDAQSKISTVNPINEIESRDMEVPKKTDLEPSVAELIASAPTENIETKLEVQSTVKTLDEVTPMEMEKNVDSGSEIDRKCELHISPTENPIMNSENSEELFPIKEPTDDIDRQNEPTIKTEAIPDSNECETVPKDKSQLKSDTREAGEDMEISNAEEITAKETGSVINNEPENTAVSCKDDPVEEDNSKTVENSTNGTLENLNASEHVSTSGESCAIQDNVENKLSDEENNKKTIDYSPKQIQSQQEEFHENVRKNIEAEKSCETDDKTEDNSGKSEQTSNVNSSQQIVEGDQDTAENETTGEVIKNDKKLINDPVDDIKLKNEDSKEDSTQEERVSTRGKRKSSVAKPPEIEHDNTPKPEPTVSKSKRRKTVPVKSIIRETPPPSTRQKRKISEASIEEPSSLSNRSGKTRNSSNTEPTEEKLTKETTVKRPRRNIKPKQCYSP